MLIFKFFYKNINISFKKLKFFIKSFKNLSLCNLFIYLKFLNNKISIIIKKLILNSINNIKMKIKNFDLNFLNKFLIFSNKGSYFKKPFYRSKGVFNIIKKYNSNIFFLFYLNGTKN